MVVDIPETLLKAESGSREVPQLYLVYIPSLLILSVIGAISRNRLFHAAFPVFWLVSLLLYLGLRVLAQIQG
ncbi:hypothetical protein ACFL3S_10555 [Gemmatimonadota bacterium]